MGLSRQEYWSGLPCPPPGDPPKTGIEPRSPTLQADSLPSELPGKPTVCHRGYKTTRIPCAKVKLKKKIRWNNNEENFTESLSYVVAERSRCLGSHRCVTHGPTVRARSFWPKPFCLFFLINFLFYIFLSLWLQIPWLFHKVAVDSTRKQAKTKFLMPVFLHNAFKYFPPTRGDSGSISAALRM